MLSFAGLLAFRIKYTKENKFLFIKYVFMKYTCDTESLILVEIIRAIVGLTIAQKLQRNANVCTRTLKRLGRVNAALNLLTSLYKIIIVDRKFGID